MSRHVEHVKQKEPRISISAGLLQGLVLTMALTLVARQLATVPFFQLIGVMVTAILLGITWRSLMGLPAPAWQGVNFAVKWLLRLGVVLMGIRLDMGDIFKAGPRVILLDAAVIFLTITLFRWLGRRFSLDEHTSLLLGVGTGICGASAIAAMAPAVNANEEKTALAVAVISIVGTFGALVYSLIQPWAGLTPYGYGVWAGASLQEVGHVIAAAATGGQASSEIGILVKLGRVALLVPVTLLLGILFPPAGLKESQAPNRSRLSVPWFVLGFLGFSAVKTAGIVTAGTEELVLKAAVFTLTVAMAGLGLNVNLAVFRQVGQKTLLVGTLGFVIIALAARVLLALFNIH